MSSISELKFDDKNFNLHTQYGMSLLEKSLRENGAGRSILIDKDNNIIAGNGIIEAAGSIGLDKLKVVETTGDEIVAVKRTDLSLDSAQARQMALADNAVANADLKWDNDTIEEVSEKFGFDPGDWGMKNWASGQDYVENERERTYKSTNLDMFNAERANNKYGFPELKGAYPDFVPERLIGFNEMKTSSDYGAGVHFFIDDYQFERIWNEPKKYIEPLSNFACVFTPDFSLYMDMPLAMKIWNIYRSRLVGQILEEEGLVVVPTLSWAGRDTFEFCFDGLPHGSTYAVSTVGVMRDEEALRTWKEGMDEARRVLEPKRILLYTTKKDIDYDWGDMSVVRYNARSFNGV